MRTTGWKCAALAAVLVGAAGCGAAAEKVSEKAIEKAIEAQGGGDVDLDLSSDGMKVTTKDGTYTVDSNSEGFRVESSDGSYSMGTDLPKSWPSDIPLPDFTSVSAMEGVQDGTITITVNGMSKGTAEALKNKTAAALSSWEMTDELTNTANGKRTEIFSMKNGERELYVSASENDEGLGVSFSYTGPK